MNYKEFTKYLDRDVVCYHCGTTANLVPHHRLNRGMGGSKERDTPANIIAMCSFFNGIMESDLDAGTWARDHGWKLRNGDDPRKIPVASALGIHWYLLDDKFGKVETNAPDKR